MHGEGAVGVLQPQLPALQHDAVVITEHREQDLAAQLLLQWSPVDVEVIGVGRGAPVLEHVLPPGVGAAGDAHVVRHHVDEHPHAALAQPRRQGLQILVGADLWVEMSVVGDVVAVGAARCGTEEWRRVECADPEVMEIRNDGACVRKGKPRVELDPIG